MKTTIAALIAASALFCARGYADEEKPFGTVEQALVCQKELERTGGNWNSVDKKALAADCMAEVQKQIPVCVEDPGVKKITDDPKYSAHSDPKGYCEATVWYRMRLQQKAYEAEQEKTKKAEAQKAALEGTELPKATKHDAKLEKLVADAYHRDYPEGKVLRVILGNWSDDYEKDAFGRVNGRDLDATVVNRQPDGKCQLHNEYWLQHGNGRSFSGPLSARGAGSMNTKEILCSKVDGAGGTTLAAKKTKKK